MGKGVVTRGALPMCMPPLPPANLCKKAQVKSCTECIRVHQDCAYCTDEVSLCVGPAQGHFPLPRPPLALANCTLATPAAWPWARWVWRRGKGQEHQGEVNSGLGQPGDGPHPHGPLCFWPDVQGAALQHPGRAAGRGLPAGKHSGHGEQLGDHGGAWSRAGAGLSWHKAGWVWGPWGLLARPLE